MSLTGVGERIETGAALIRDLLTDLPQLTVSIDDVVAARRLRDVMDVAVSWLAEQHSRTTPWPGTGTRDYSAWFAHHTKAAQGEAVRRLAACDVMRLLPELGEAVEGGRVSAEHLRVLVSTLTPKRQPLLVRDAEVILEFACILPLTDFRTFMADWAAKADDELNDPTTIDGHEERRSLQLTQQSNQSWHVNGTLTPEAGELLHNALAAALPKKTTEDHRSIAQRRHDALEDVIRLSLSVGERGTVGGEVPHLSVVHHVEDGTTRSASHW
jgi:hypothetical protein